MLPEGPRTCLAVVSSTPPRLMRLFELSAVAGMSPGCVGDVISLPSRAPGPKRISGPTCEVPTNASCPRFGDAAGLNPVAAGRLIIAGTSKDGRRCGGTVPPCGVEGLNPWSSSGKAQQSAYGRRFSPA